MPNPKRTQKQIAERYKGNLGYYREKHPWRRARFWASFLAIFGGLAAIYLFQTRGRETFFSAGVISSAHARFGDDCAKCHDNARMNGITFTNWTGKVAERFQHGIDFGAIDRKCEQCHQQHTLHAPNVIENRSCSACHQEHQGPGSMKAVAALNCAACHNSRDVMEASSHKGRQIPPAAFRLRPRSAQRVVLDLPRPAQGYTAVFASFASGHPEFQLDYEKARDPNVLRFNHQRHEAADIPLVQGRKLDCNYCHKPDSEGRFYQRISFAANCQACHALQFDAKNPELVLPHGDAAAVRGFLRTLPTQYADLAVRRKGLSRPNEIQKFVTQQMTQLRERVRSGEDFERQIFFTTDPYKPSGEAGPRARASFTGCAFCHEVKAVANAAPAITKLLLIDRWMPRANFNHAKHTSIKCNDCHHASQSRETADALMPVKQNCVVCHSPQGKVVAECITCHTYHAAPSLAAGQASSGSGVSFKEMVREMTKHE